MSYFTIYGNCESIDDSSYERDVPDPENEDNTIKETVPQVTITLQIPGMRDLVRASFGVDTMPKVDQANAWEDKGVMLRISADKSTTTSGVRGKKAWAVTSYHGLSVQEATAQEVKANNDERKLLKVKAKARRDEEKAKAKAKSLKKAS